MCGALDLVLGRKNTGDGFIIVRIKSNVEINLVIHAINVSLKWTGEA